MFDLPAYLERIGVPGTPTLQELHRAHVCSIPFENLDPHRGIPVSLDPQDLQRKLVAERRGGYCFEHNLLAKGALEALGFEVFPLLARVRVGGDGVRPRSHLLLRVETGGERPWHVDVGFGASSPLEPLPWGPGGPWERAGWRYRIVEQGPEWVLQVAGSASGWEDLYGFVPEPVPIVDIETSNWFTATHPRSPFVTGLVVGLHEPDGSTVTVRDWDGLALTRRTPAGESRSAVELSDLPVLLEERFGLPGFGVGPDGRIVAASAAGVA